jgi:predicted AAA+ superfamily ATPase
MNYASLSIEAGVDAKTVTSWLGVLESSFIIFLLRPHHQNFNKTVVKRPKVYFHDTALVCSLLGITNTIQLATHPLRGALFEGMVVTELYKRRANLGLPINLFYWRSKAGQEVDVIIDCGGNLYPIEIKSGMTVHPEHLRNLRYWMRLSDEKAGVLLHAGVATQRMSDGIEVINWRKFREDDWV